MWRNCATSSYGFVRGIIYFMTIFESIILGIVQGISEFLPVSSSGHLVILHEWFGDVGNTLSFDIFLHLATLLAVLVYFYHDIVHVIQTAWRLVLRKEVAPAETRLVYALIIGTIPAGLLGALFASDIESLFRSTFSVAYALIAGSIVFWFAEKIYANRLMAESLSSSLTITKGFLVGCFQVLALIPGMSRSGSTISGGLILGLSREQAVRFSFLLSIPIILGAGVMKILGGDGITLSVPVILGGISAFVAGLGAIHFLVRYLKNHTLMAFVWYRVLVAFLLLTLW